MLSNHVYNLLSQIVTESKSLARIKDSYIVDDKGCDDCDVFWQKMIISKDANITELEGLIKKHCH